MTGSGTLASKNANTTATNISGLGTLGLTGTNAGNYNIASGTVLVTPKNVIVTGTRQYDGTTGASGEILSVTSGEISGDGVLTVTGSGTLASKNANTTATNISSLGTLDLTGTNAGNYTIASGTVLVTPRDVVVTGTRVYDGTTGADSEILSVTSGEISGDGTLTVTGSSTYGEQERQHHGDQYLRPGDAGPYRHQRQQLRVRQRHRSGDAEERDRDRHAPV